MLNSIKILIFLLTFLNSYSSFLQLTSNPQLSNTFYSPSIIKGVGLDENITISAKLDLYFNDPCEPINSILHSLIILVENHHFHSCTWENIYENFRQANVKGVIFRNILIPSVDVNKLSSPHPKNKSMAFVYLYKPDFEQVKEYILKNNEATATLFVDDNFWLKLFE
ncbi:hypothetical protein HK099_002577 [Clydaea vesicula]|uniref:Uncharacterized protein n=1 Tax=Clydaea vesicula TaxID=447962 RepID=A0AAD5TVW5_9FUNG|nr:hypothetical protein HK099_002577 [Clydaea vesicula]